MKLTGFVEVLESPSCSRGLPDSLETRQGHSSRAHQPSRHRLLPWKRYPDQVENAVVDEVGQGRPNLAPLNGSLGMMAVRVCHGVWKEGQTFRGNIGDD